VIKLILPGVNLKTIPLAVTIGGLALIALTIAVIGPCLGQTPAVAPSGLNGEFKVQWRGQDGSYRDIFYRFRTAADGVTLTGAAPGPGFRDRGFVDGKVSGKSFSFTVPLLGTATRSVTGTLIPGANPGEDKIAINDLGQTMTGKRHHQGPKGRALK
jgi:hypothetical protein